MYCKECGNQIADGSKFCADCGTPQNREVVSNPENSNADILQLKYEIKKLKQDKSKSKLIALFLCLFFGHFGAHRFYVGKIGTGFLMLFFFAPSVYIFYATRDIEEVGAVSGRGLSEIGSTFQMISTILVIIFGIWLLIDLIRIITGSFIDSRDYEISETDESKPVVTQKIEQKSISLDIKQKKETSFYFIGILLGIIIIIIIIVSAIHVSAIYASVSPSKSTFTDQRDGRVYESVRIGTQTWMAENLNYNVSSSKCYDNKPENCKKYGRLYNWETARKACPSGWHLPSKGEYETLNKTVGDERVAGRKLKAKSGWSNDGNGSDEFGFSALPGGYGDSGGSLYDVGYYGLWWSANEGDSDNAYYRSMIYNYGPAYWSSRDKSCLRSVRCVQD